MLKSEMINELRIVLGIVENLDTQITDFACGIYIGQLQILFYMQYITEEKFEELKNRLFNSIKYN